MVPNDVAADHAMTDDHSLGGTQAGGTQGFLAAGGLLGALAASSCCIVPLVFFGLGVSGAWIGNLTALAPYQPLFVLVSLGFLAFGFRKVYGGKQEVCAVDGACATPVSERLVKSTLWGAAILVAMAAAFPFVAPYFLG